MCIWVFNLQSTKLLVTVLGYLGGSGVAENILGLYLRLAIYEDELVGQRIRVCVTNIFTSDTVQECPIHKVLCGGGPN